MLQADIERAKELFGELLAGQTERIEKMKQAGAAPDYTQMDKIVIGVIPGDGIGRSLWSRRSAW